MRRPRAQDGFTIPEVLVAMVLLLVGLGGGLRLLDGAAATTTSSRAREQGTALARDVLETARSVRFDALPPVGTAGVVQAANPTLADAGGSVGWDVVRRGVTYTIAVGACTVDDPGDGFGTRDPATFCAAGSGTATPDTCRTALGSSGDIAGTGVAAPDCGVDTDRDGTVNGLIGACTVGCAPSATPDPAPSDFKRVVALVRWRVGTGTRYILESTTIPGLGGQGGPPVSALVANTGMQPDGTVRITAPGVEALTFTATTGGAPAGLRWTVDGVGLAGGTGGGTSWTVPWALGKTSPPGSAGPAADEVPDGVRSVQATPLTADGRTGTARALTVVLDRRKPFPPQGVTATNLYPAPGATVRTQVAVEWDGSVDGDVVGYRVKRKTASGPAQIVCPLQTTMKCNDEAPPAVDTEYWVVALDGTAASPREGDDSARATARALNRPPTTPDALKATVTTDEIVLTWSASTDPDGDAIVAYRIVVDGKPVDPPNDVPGDQLSTTFDRDGGNHSFTVAAIDAQGLASAPSAAVNAK